MEDIAQQMVTVISVITNSDGTRTSTLLTTPTILNSSTPSSSSDTGKTWGIVGGVVGGVLLLSAGIFVVYRLTQKRFSDLNDGVEEIKWPELRPDGHTAATSTLNPQGTRRLGGAGVEMERDGSEWGGEEGTRPDSSYEHLGYGATTQMNDGYCESQVRPVRVED